MSWVCRYAPLRCVDLVTAEVSSTGGVGRVDMYRLGNFATSVNASPYSVGLSDLAGTGHLPAWAFSASATDVDGNVGSSP
jgi:hypothetical protein